MKAVAVFLDASLLILALCVLFLPEAHTPSMRNALFGLLVIVASRGLW